MLQATTFQFLTDLSANNHKTWFDANKERYTKAKDNIEQIVSQLLVEMAAYEPALANVTAKDCIMRIFKDVRFAKDKTPYKTNFGAAFSKGGKNFTGAGYYLHLEPNGKSFLGGGVWMPQPDVLKKVRQEIDYNYEEFLGIINNPAFKATYPTIDGEKLKKPPKEYTPDNPAIEYLKLKSFTTFHSIKNDNVLMEQGAVKWIAQTFETMQPFIRFLNRAVEG
ncbi:MAG: DUF2461 domain-containing protein [Chitinophagia bacterium]|nr:DUF2461 domain-containing protein [Chitinophagia bacterium]